MNFGTWNTVLSCLPNFIALNFVCHLLYINITTNRGKDVSIENLHHGFTHVFESTFETKEGLAEYIAHPVHVEFANGFLSSLDKVLVVDFEPTTVNIWIKRAVTVILDPSMLPLIGTLLCIRFKNQVLSHWMWWSVFLFVLSLLCQVRLEIVPKKIINLWKPMHISQLFQKAANLSSTLFVFSGTKK